MKNRARLLLQDLRIFWSEYRVFLLCLLLFYLVWKTFYLCLGNGFVNYDDQAYVYDNAHVKSGFCLRNIYWAFTSTTSANWHPITMLSHILDWQLYGGNPWGHHLLNVILHCFNSMLLFLLMQRSTGAIWKSFAVALFFGLHPLRVESVAWVSERKDVLSTLFLMLAALAYLKYVTASARKNADAKLHFFYALLWFLLGLLCKPMLVTFPFLLLLLDFWPLQRWKRQTVFGLLKEKWPFFLLSGVFCMVTVFAQTGARYSLIGLPLSSRLEGMPISYCRYIGKIFYPTDLAVFYPYPIPWSVADVIFSAVLLMAISAIVFMAARRRPYVLVGWLWFLGMLFPVIGLMQAGRQSIADRYTYIPCVGLLLIAVWCVSEVALKWKISFAGLLIAAGGLAVTCSSLTRLQILYWKDGESLFRHAAAVTEKNYLAYDIIGNFDLGRKNYNAAITNFQKALVIRNDKLESRISLGIALTKIGRSDEAIRTLQEAVLQEPSKAEAHKELALALLSKGRRDEALTNLAFSLQLKADYPEAREELRKLTNSLPRLSPN